VGAVYESNVRRTGLFISGLIVLPTLVFLSSHASTRNEAIAKSTGTQLPGLADLPHLAGGQRVDLATADAEIQIPLIRPDTDLASDSSIDQLWAREGEDEYVLIEYESGIDVEIRPSTYGDDPGFHWKNQITDGVPGDIIDVGGYPAFAVPPDSDGSSGSVDMVFENVNVTIIGNGTLSMDELEKVAASTAKASTTETED
jgi:hypothetical protein